MLTVHVCARIKLILISILGIFRRALCCFSRKRRLSESEQFDVVVVESNYQNKKVNPNHVERDWNSWDDTPKTIQEHIEVYREKLVQTKSVESNEEQNLDFFRDMTPAIKKQTKVLINDNNEKNLDFSRLQAHLDIPAVNELEDWEDDQQNNAWDELNDETTKRMIIEKRKEMRAQRNAKMRGDSGSNSQFAAKISNSYT